MANANRNSSDRAALGGSTFRRQLLLLQERDIVTSRVHATTATGKSARARCPIRWGSVMKRSLVLFTSDFAMVLCATRGDRWPDVRLWKAAD